MELNEEELDLVGAGYDNYALSLQSKIDAYKSELSNPSNSSSERLAIYNKIEELQNELDSYINDKQFGGRSR